MWVSLFAVRHVLHEFVIRTCRIRHECLKRTLSIEEHINRITVRLWREAFVESFLEQPYN